MMIGRQYERLKSRDSGKKKMVRNSLPGAISKAKGVKMFQKRPISSIGTVILVLLLLSQSSFCHRQQSFEELQLQQQQQQRQQQQQQSEGGGGELSFGNQGNGEYSPLSVLSEGPINLGQPSYNSKRARKMSAFMPMRGRKDGRDALSNGGLDQLVEQGNLLSELDGGDSSILRLVSNRNGEPQFHFSWAAPRQFANQMTARHLMSGRTSALAPAPQSANIVDPIENGQQFGFMGSSAEQLAAPPAVMQAKLRRAFHPMRGKKSDPNMETLIGGRVASMEVASPLDMQTDD